MQIRKEGLKDKVVYPEEAYIIYAQDCITWLFRLVLDPEGVNEDTEKFGDD